MKELIHGTLQWVSGCSPSDNLIDELNATRSKVTGLFEIRVGSIIRDAGKLNSAGRLSNRGNGRWRSERLGDNRIHNESEWLNKVMRMHTVFKEWKRRSSAHLNGWNGC